MKKDTRKRLEEIRRRVEHISPGPWRNTIRRESAREVAKALERNCRPGNSQCSEVVVNTDRTPTVDNVICWMGPAAGQSGDDLVDAHFIANAREDIAWLLELVDELLKEKAH